MGSTFLKLTNDVLRKLNEVELTDTTFPSARGIHAMAKDAVRDAVKVINTQKFEWPFNATTGSQTLTAGTTGYTWPSDLKIPDWESFYIENDGTLATETVVLKQISKEDYWKYFRANDLDAGVDGIETPRYVFELSNGGFGITPSPDEAYIVKYTYFINTVDLEDFDDVCTVPTLYDYVILIGALEGMYQFMDNAQRSALSNQSFKKAVSDMAYILIPKSPSMTGGVMNTGLPHVDFYFDEGSS